MEIDHVFASGAVVGRAARGATGDLTRAWWRAQPRLLTQKRGQFLQPLLNNGAIVEVWEWMSSFISRIVSIHVSKMSPCSQGQLPILPCPYRLNDSQTTVQNDTSLFDKRNIKQGSGWIYQMIIHSYYQTQLFLLWFGRNIRGIWKCCEEIMY